MRSLLIVSDSPTLFSGQARVVRELAARCVRDKVGVTVAGWGAQLRSEQLPYAVHPILPDHPETLSPVINAVNPDVILCIGDPWRFEWLARQRQALPSVRLAGYFNIESPAPLPFMWEHIFDAFDDIMTTSQWGAAQLAAGAWGPRAAPKAIHHGVDLDVFRHLGTKPTIPGFPSVEGLFVVLLNAQNTQRKNLPTALRAFARLAHQHDNVLCYANTQAHPQAHQPMGYYLNDLVAQLGLEAKVLFNSSNMGPGHTMPDDGMAQVYALADALFMTSMNEGFCLPVLEAQATNVRVVAPAHGPFIELANEAHGGILYDPGSTFVGDQETIKYAPNEQAAAVALERAYQEWRADTDAEPLARGLAHAQAHPWEPCYQAIMSTLYRTPLPRVMMGATIQPFMRHRARRLQQKTPNAIGVLKLGGLGDMLQTTRVIREAATRYQRPVVVFANTGKEVFEAMPDVVDTLIIGSQPQADAVRSLVQQFEIFLDVRYISKSYGLIQQPPRRSMANQWFYEEWPHSSARLSTMERHTTELMLESLGLPTQDITPIFTPRSGTPPDGPYAVISTGSSGLGQLKQWPVDAWTQVVTWLQAHVGVVYQVGGVEDPPIPGVRLRMGLSIAQTATLIEHAKVFVTIENGLAHLAAATTCPAVIVLFGPTPMASFAYPTHINLGHQSCPPCFWAPGWGQLCTAGWPACVNLSTPDEVLQVLSEVRRVGSVEEWKRRGVLA